MKWLRFDFPALPSLSEVHSTGQWALPTWATTRTLGPPLPQPLLKRCSSVRWSN